MKRGYAKARTIKGPAMLWKRLFAFIVDFFVLELIVVLPFRNILTGMMPQQGITATYEFLARNQGTANIMFMVTFIMVSLMFLYFTVLEYGFGQSIGKMLMDIRAESVKGDLKLWQVLVRNMWIFPVFPFVVLWVVDPAYMIFTKDHTRFSEMITRTRTVQEYRV
ncbi:hypothetical protein GF351_04520 [Candidatus Woesearchaeota archaeon]|nr:hypothetical protein [Candidatus Woesearchaeota archaeon]